MSIEAVIFDYGNVIARFDVQIYLRRVAPYSRLSPGELAIATKNATPTFIAYETGEISSDEFLSTISQQCSLNITRDDFLRAYTGIFTPIETTRNLIRQLHGRYRLALLSNTSEWHFQYEISRNPVFPLFETVTVSHVVKSRKPEEKIYLDALSKLRLPPLSCVYVDDIVEFADTATKLGMHGIHYTTHDRLTASFKSLNILLS